MEKDFEKARKSFDTEINANSLLAKSVDHQWHEYLGNPINIGYLDRTMRFEAGMYYGLKPSAFGYNMETQVFHEGPLPISFRDGYTLSKMSRQLSKREAKFKMAI